MGDPGLYSEFLNPQSQGALEVWLGNAVHETNLLELEASIGYPSTRSTAILQWVAARRTLLADLRDAFGLVVPPETRRALNGTDGLPTAEAIREALKP